MRRAFFQGYSLSIWAGSDGDDQEGEQTQTPAVHG